MTIDEQIELLRDWLNDDKPALERKEALLEAVITTLERAIDWQNALIEFADRGKWVEGLWDGAREYYGWQGEGEPWQIAENAIEGVNNVVVVNND